MRPALSCCALLFLGCAPRQAPVEAANAALTTGAEDVGSLAVAASVGVEGLTALACGPRDCRAVIQGALMRLDPATLGLKPTGHQVSGWPVLGKDWSMVQDCAAGLCLQVPGSTGTPAPMALASVPTRDPRALSEQARSRFELGWRSPFEPRAPSPAGGVLTYLRGTEGPSGRLARLGATPRMTPAPGTPHPAAWTRWVAVHPTGGEAYLLVWPGAVLLAFDPATLETRWRVRLDRAAHGLFIDRKGRWLVAETGGNGDPERVLDHTIEAQIPEGWDPGHDLVWGQTERPDATETVVVDLPGRGIAARVPGRYVAWAPVDGQGVILATDRQIVRLVGTGAGPQPPPRPE